MKRNIRRLTVLMMVMALMLTSAVTAFAAGEPTSESTGNHTHSFGPWEVTVEPTYFAAGEKVRTCSCGETEIKKVAKLKGNKNWAKNEETGEWVYFNSEGKRYKGWHRMKLKNTGKTKWCYFNSKGIYIKSVDRNTRRKWVKADGKKFYFTTNKKPLGAGFNFVNNKLYYMDKYGAVKIGKFKASDGKKYKTRKDGSITGIAYLTHKYKAFVLIDISSQRLRFYRNGKARLSTGVVTGTRGVHDTPTGNFSVTGKSRDINLVGPTWNAHVNYWMSFIGSSYGMHDASWRSSSQFSNNKTYINNGSHGCVNMGYSAAQKLYKMVKVGTPVIVQK